MDKRFLMMVTAVVVGLGGGWLLPAQDAAAPTWVDTKEYEMAQEIPKATTDADRIKALDAWAKAYPNNPLWLTRDETYLQVYGNMKDYRKLYDKAKEIRAKKPEHYFAITTILGTIFQFPTASVAEPDLATADQTARYVLDNTAKVFEAANKPANATDEQWAQYRPAVMSLAQRVAAYVPVARKDYPKAEVESAKVVKDDATQAQFSYFLGDALIRQRVPAKVTPGIFHIARAAAYEGQNALPAPTRQQAREYVTSIYKQYHGSEEGLNNVLMVAKTNAMPPEGFKIESAQEIAMREFANQEEYDKAHPDLAFWRDTVKTPLTGPDADSLFESNYKNALLPPEGQSFDKFKVKIISLSPETNPKEITAALAESSIPDVKLILETPLPGTMMEGEELQFKGTVQSFQKDPFLVTFEIDKETKGEVTGWTGKAAAKAGKAPAGSKAGGGKAGTKNK